jgi:hypothetical protein
MFTFLAKKKKTFHTAMEGIKYLLTINTNYTLTDFTVFTMRAATL